MHTTRILTLKGAQCQGQVLVPLTLLIGGKVLLTNSSTPSKAVATGGSAPITWSMTTVPTNLGTQSPHPSVWLAFKFELPPSMWSNAATSRSLIGCFPLFRELLNKFTTQIKLRCISFLLCVNVHIVVVRARLYGHYIYIVC